jgi:hypothetical protein
MGELKLDDRGIVGAHCEKPGPGSSRRWPGPFSTRPASDFDPTLFGHAIIGVVVRMLLGGAHQGHWVMCSLRKVCPCYKTHR